jgi:hypothetical protein
MQAIFSSFFSQALRSGHRMPNRGAPTQSTVPGQAGNHPETRCSETIAKPRIEFGQRVCSVLLVLNRKIFPIAAYLTAPYLE